MFRDWLETDEGVATARQRFRPQSAIGVETDDLNGPLEGRARLHRPYFQIAVVLFLATAVIGAGYFGPHPAPSASPHSGASPFAANLTPAASASPVAGTNAPAGLTRVNLRPGQLRQTWLPGEITSGSMAVVGANLYFIVDGDVIESTAVGGDASRQMLAQAPPCQGINQLAAAGHELAYVVTSPGGLTAQVHDCGEAGRVSWSLWLLDLNGGSPRQVAQGARTVSSIEVAEFPVHLALTESAYAFNRPALSPATGAGETVEVHAIDGRLLWTSRTQRPVADVMLGGGTLAILTDIASQAPGVGDLYVSDAIHPDPAPVDPPARSASLSSDGLHLTWDVAQQGPPGAGPPIDVALETVGSGVEQPLTTLTDSLAAAPLRPAVSSTSRGPLVTWFATAPSGAIYPALRYAAGDNGSFLPSLQEPIWMSVQSGMLFWVAEGAGGWSKVAFAVDLASLGLH